MTIADKLIYLSDTKALIKSAIEDKGVVVPEETTFREYADKISQISGGGGGGGNNAFTLIMGKLIGGNHGVTDIVLPPSDAGDIMYILHMRTNSSALTSEPEDFTLVDEYISPSDYTWRLWARVSTGEVDPLTVPGVELTSDGQHAYPFIIKGGQFLSLIGEESSQSIPGGSWGSSGPHPLPAGDSIVFTDFYTTRRNTGKDPQHKDITSPIGIEVESYSQALRDPSEFTTIAVFWDNLGVKFRATEETTFTSRIRRIETQNTSITKYYVSCVFVPN